MQRIVKRFLLHKQRETDEVGETDFEELKQDLQMVRYEMINDLKKSREETLRLIHHISSGLIIIGDELFLSKESLNSNKFKEFSATEFEFYDNFTDLKLVEPSTSKDQNNSNNNLNSIPNVKTNFSIINRDTQENPRSSFGTQSAPEIVQLNSSSNRETDSAINNLKPSTIKDLIDNKKLNSLSNNQKTELMVINEAEESDAKLKNEPSNKNSSEINPNSIIIIEKTEQGVQSTNNDDVDDELAHSDKMYII
jgi:hypothetical protein